MKFVYSIFLSLFLLAGCTSIIQNEVDILQVPIIQAKFCVYPIDSTKVLNPRGIYCYQDYLVIIEGKNSPVFSFWKADNLQFCFSAGFIGGGPNEFIHPRSDYFATSDSSFFILDSNIEYEVQIFKESIRIINKEPIIIPDAINQMVHLNDNKYIMAGNTDGENSSEHFLYDANLGNYISFGEYPSKNLSDRRKFLFDFKYTAGRSSKPYIWDFYENHNLIRQYSIEGNLLQEIHLCNIEERKNSDTKSRDLQNRPYWRVLQTTSQHIYTLFYRGETDRLIYSEGTIPELQEWDWQGNLTKRILFDRKYDRITVSEAGILYAINTIDDFNNQIYSYKLQD